MRIYFLEMSGFRGFRDKVRVEFGRGFTIITGRNGAGKSTLCDAVEFAITGSIEKYTVEKAAKESLNDYLWWRGEGTPAAHYVTVSFLTDDDKQFTITRSRERGANRTIEEIRAALCASPAPDDALRQLMRTSIIRDEWIAALSLDLTETERFDLVRSALGAVEDTESAARAKEIVVAADRANARNEEKYAAARSRLSDRIAQQAEAQAALSRSGDLAAAHRRVSAAIPDVSSDVISQLESGRKVLAERRTRLAHMGEALQLARELAIKQQAFNSQEAVDERQGALTDRDSARKAKDAAVAAVTEAEERLAQEEEVDAIAASLTHLVEHGERLGLHDDHCPLCAAYRTSEEFSAGLESARRRIATLSSGVPAARDAVAAARESARQPSLYLETTEAQVRSHTEAEQRLRAQEEAHVEFFDRIGLDHRFIGDVDSLGMEFGRERNLLIDLERALHVLDASQYVSRISSIESDIVELRSEIDNLADAVSQSQSAATAAREIERSVKLVSAEIIDERLAQISPLLNELYQRLRPHADWRTIDYSIRGDVRRFLSLKVGNGLNPQFVFSSGQRRAAGLAFLLSVHLSRGWTPLRMLVLDDPVQHIDDFRALQLMEVLAALRVDGRQIVCAVEDPALADLLCRRLHSTQTTEGRRLDVDLGPKGSNVVIGETDIAPLPVGVLRRNGGLHVVGD